MNKMFTGSSTQNTLRMTDVHMFFAFILIIFKFWWETWTARGGEGEKIDYVLIPAVLNPID